MDAETMQAEIDRVYAEWLAMTDRLTAMRREVRRLRAVAACERETRLREVKA